MISGGDGGRDRRADASGSTKVREACSGVYDALSHDSTTNQNPGWKTLRVAEKAV